MNSPIQTLYVATNGRDDWSGRLPEPKATGTDGPFATLQRARDAIRQMRKQNGGRELAGPVTVHVRGGRYLLREPLWLGPEDSGKQHSPVTWAAYPGEKPILSGGAPGKCTSRRRE